MEASIIYEKPLSGQYPELTFGNTRANSTWVLFSDDGTNEWVGIFAHSFGHSGLMKIQPLMHAHFMIYAGGAIYLLDAISRSLVESFEDPFLSDAVFHERRKELIVADWIRLRGIRAGRTIWQSKRIALDGIHSLNISGDKITGVAEFYDGQNEAFEFSCETYEVRCKYSFAE